MMIDGLVCPRRPAGDKRLDRDITTICHAYNRQERRATITDIAVMELFWKRS
jgi:hypothetical protein